MNFETPILLLICNRPEETEITFSKIREMKPKNLFVSQDGKDEETFNKIKVDWSCNYHYRWSNKRQGCKNGVLNGINWFFNNVESGIILEDDTVPDLSFFPFCRKLLQVYKDDKKVWQIAGSNFQDYKGNGTYYFTQNIHCWGWGTWADRWKQFTEKFDYSLIPKNQKWLIKYLENIDKYDTWDYQWAYTILSNNGVSIAPKVNLIENIGFDGSGTHMKYGSHFKSEPMQEILFPVQVNYKADKRELRQQRIKKYFETIKYKLKSNEQRN